MSDSTTTVHRSLEALGLLEAEDRQQLDALLEHRERHDVGDFVFTEGTRLTKSYVMLEGWAARYKGLPDGNRQILNFLFPGDIVCLFAPFLGESEFGVEALTGTEVASFPADQLLNAFRESPRLAVGLAWLAAKAERLLDEQIVRIGRRPAYERMAHLFIELCRRSRLAGLSREEARLLPLTQSVLADALGMSHVHANRSFRTLARRGLVRHRHDRIELMDTDALAEIAGFDPGYLDPDPMSHPARQHYRD